MRYLVVIIAFLTVTAAYAQDGLNRSVDVAKDFMPLLERAHKIPVASQMDDTTTLRPDFRYIVRPRAWVSRFQVSPVRAARMDIAPPERQGPLYAKFSGGAPGQSLADIYLTTRHAGVYANHRGQWADIDNAMARTVKNSVGIFGRIGVGRWTMGGELSIAHDSYADYLADGRKQNYTMPEAAITVSHDYFYLGANGWLLQQRDESGGEVFAEVRRRFGEHFLRFGASVSAWNKNNIIGIIPRYEFDGRRVVFRLGAEVANDHSKEKLWFLPELELRLNGDITPYLKLGGGLYDNTNRTLASVNPYIGPQFRFIEAPGASAEHTLHAGLSGRIGRAVSWNVYAGGEIRRNALLKSSAVPCFVDKINAFTAGLELEAQAGELTASLTAEYLKYNKLKDYLPVFNSSLTAGYSYEKWAVRASVVSHGGYRFFGTEIKAPAATDLNIEAEYKLSENIGVVVSGGNLLGQKLYPYTLHRGIGRNVSAGVKLIL